MAFDQGFNAIDFWLGGLAEAKVPGGMLGSTFDFIFAMQMIELQDGDRFYYLNRLGGTNLLAEIEAQLFSDVVMRNTGVENLYTDIFSVPDATVDMTVVQPFFNFFNQLANNKVDTTDILGNEVQVGTAGWAYDYQAGAWTFYGNTGDYLDARGVVSPNGVGSDCVVFVGTGRYLGLGDLTAMSVQSLYAIKEDLSTDWGDFRDAAGVVQQTLSAAGSNRMITSESVVWAESAGWFVDFDIVEGERINTDMVLDRGVLVVVTNVPEADACNVGGYSYIYFFDYKTGSYVTTVEGDIVGYRLANAMAVGMSVIRVNGRSVAIVTTSDNKHIAAPVPEYSGSGTMKRMLWRELFVQ